MPTDVKAQADFWVGFTIGDPEFKRFGSMTTRPPPVPDPNFLSEDYHVYKLYDIL